MLGMGNKIADSCQSEGWNCMSLFKNEKSGWGARFNKKIQAVVPVLYQGNIEIGGKKNDWMDVVLVTSWSNSSLMARGTRMPASGL